MAKVNFPVIVAAASSSVVVAASVAIDKIRWIGATTAGHELIITDTDGNRRFRSVASGANYVESETFISPLESTGIKVPTLGSGEVYIYILKR